MLVTFVGCAGVGKNTIIDELIKSDPDYYGMFPTLTTREPREGEKEGERYHFVSPEEFKKRLAEGEIYEHEIIHSSNTYYGGSKKVLEKHLATGKTLIKDIDVLGARTYKQKLSGITRILSVFLYVEDLEILIERMRMRGDKEEDIMTRRKRFPMEMAMSSDSEYMVNNISITETAAAINAIIRNEDELGGWYRPAEGCEVQGEDMDWAELTFNGNELLITAGAAAYAKAMREGRFIQKKVRTLTNCDIKPADTSLEAWKNDILNA